MKRILTAAAFVACLPVANLMIQHVGTTCIPQGPCLVPVGFGLMAPSGVLLVGLALVLRDAVHETWGRVGAASCVAVGAVLSLPFVPGPLLTASLVAFLLSELADLLVYDRLRRRGAEIAVAASGIAGAAIDTALFSAIAFGTLAWQPGLLVGKLYATAAVAGVLALRRRFT